jgi:hypothetical protein
MRRQPKIVIGRQHDGVASIVNDPGPVLAIDHAKISAQTVPLQVGKGAAKLVFQTTHQDPNTSVSRYDPLSAIRAGVGPRFDFESGAFD